MASILVIEDTESMREGIERILTRVGHEVRTTASPAEGVELFLAHRANLVITDYKMEGMDGFAVIERIREMDPNVPIIVITAFGSIELAVKAMQVGAFDFITKPFTNDVLRVKAARALQVNQLQVEHEKLEAETAILRQEAASQHGIPIIGTSAKMLAVFETVRKVAGSDSSVLITGESGTGKELIAQELHRLSGRAAGPLIRVNCGAIAETLLETELFGHERGAFTGALKRKLGRFELAHGGTIFLDEVGDVSLAMQLKLLRVLQERELERVGGEETVTVDVRVIAATNRDLSKAIQAGQFREDLFYRLNVVPIQLPPLRERREDILPIAQYFLTKLRYRTHKHVESFDGAAAARLEAYHWPGNVRELENVVEQAMIFADGVVITAANLPAFVEGSGAPSPTLALPAKDLPLDEVLENLERQLIVRAFEKAKGVKTETARILGIKTSALYYKLEKYGIG